MNNKRLFFKVLAAISLLTILPLIILGYCAHQLFHKELSEQIEERLRTRADELTTYLDTWADMNLRLMQQNALHEDMISMDPARQTPILKSIAAEYKQWVNVANTQCPVTGQNIARSDNETLKNFADRTWFQQTAKGNISSDLVINRTHAVPTWVLAIPIQNKEKEIVGTFSLGTFVSSISEVVQSSRIGQTGIAFVISDKGRVFMHPKKELAVNFANFSKHPTLIELGEDPKKKIIFTDNQTGKRIVSYAQRSRFDWVVVVQQEHDEAYEPLAQYNRRAFLLIGGSLVLILLVTAYVARRWNRLSLILSTTGLSLAMLGTLWAIQYSYFNHHFEQFMEQQLNARSDALTRYVEMWLDMNLKMLRQNAALEDMKSSDPVKQKSLLVSIAQTYPWLFNAHRSNTLAYQTARSDSAPMLNLADRAYITKVINGEPYTSDVVVGKTTGKPTWQLAVPITDKDNKVGGVLAISSVLANLADTFTSMSAGKVGYAYLLTDKGLLVAHQKKAFNQALLDFSKHPPYRSLAQANKNKVSFKEGDKNEFVSYSQKNKYGWVIVVQREGKEGYDFIAQLNWVNTVIILTSICILLLVTPSLARRWEKTLQQ